MRRLGTLAVAGTSAIAALLLLAAPAFAHVTVSAPGATRGGSDQQITFRVPVEENSDTVGLTIAFPLNQPMASVDVVPMPGWTEKATTVKLKKPIKTDDGTITEAVSQVTWKAQSGQGLKPGQAGLFNVLAGQLPDTRSITFRAVQTYANGDVVRWIEQAAPGGNAQPEHPAPVLQLAASSPTKALTTSAASSTSGSSNTLPVVLSIVALVLAAVAVGLAFVAGARRASLIES